MWNLISVSIVCDVEFFHLWFQSQKRAYSLKGTSGRKKSLAQMKERGKCNKKEPSPTSMRQMVLEIFHFKVRNLSNMDIAIL